MNTHQARAIAALEASKSDDLRRTEKAFEGFSDKQLDAPYGQSGRTAREILSSFREKEDRINEAIAWIRGIR